MSLGPPTVPILGNEHQIPAADGHFLWVVAAAFFFVCKLFGKLEAESRKTTD